MPGAIAKNSYLVSGARDDEDEAPMNQLLALTMKQYVTTYPGQICLFCGHANSVQCKCKNRTVLTAAELSVKPLTHHLPIP